MKVTPEEETQLSVLIWNSVHFQETYDEVYDHILAAVEELPEADGPGNSWFESIIAHDFGTLDILRDREADRVKVIAVYMKKKLWKTWVAWFTFPLLAFTLFIASLSYYTVSHIPRAFTFWLIVAVGLVPFIFEVALSISTLIQQSTVKISVKAGGLATANYSISMISGFMLSQWSFGGQHELFNLLPLWVLTALFIFYMLYAISFIKV